MLLDVSVEACELKLCEVLHDGVWVEGQLLHWYRTDAGRWRGVVRFSAGLGATFQQGRDESEIRPVT